MSARNLSSSTQQREDLILSHLQLARDIARWAARRFPWLDPNDIMGDSYLGLVQAAMRFNPASGVLFRTFAKPRIRGAILDALEYRHRHNVRELSWDAPLWERVNGVAERGIEARESERKTVMRIAFEQALSKLDDKERKVVYLFRVADVPMKTIGEGMGLSEGRISQIQSGAIEKVRRMAA